MYKRLIRLTTIHNSWARHPRAYEALLLEVIPASPAGSRDRAILIVDLLTELRNREVIALRASDVRLAAGIAYYCQRIRQRIVWRQLHPIAERAIRKYLASRWKHDSGLQLEDLAAKDPIFDVSRQAHASALARYAKNAHLPSRRAFSTLATDYLKEGD